MKTPKRIAYCSCGCWLNLESGDYMDDKGKSHKCAALFCPKCGAEYRGEAFAARIIRKNRENRLKHALQRQAWNSVMLAADFRCAELSASSWKRRYREIWRMRSWVTSTYGQDIEGS